jgi:hypothetical protein
LHACIQPLEVENEPFLVLYLFAKNWSYDDLNEFSSCFCGSGKKNKPTLNVMILDMTMKEILSFGEVVGKQVNYKIKIFKKAFFSRQSTNFNPCLASWQFWKFNIKKL